MVPLPPPVRGRYLKPPTERAAPRFTVKVCGGGGLAACHCVCQMLCALPSIALAAAPFSPTISTLSAVTVQPARLMSAPFVSSRLNSAIEVQGLPATSVSASSRTYCTSALGSFDGPDEGGARRGHGVDSRQRDRKTPRLGRRAVEGAGRVVDADTRRQAGGCKACWPRSR